MYRIIIIIITIIITNNNSRLLTPFGGRCCAHDKKQQPLQNHREMRYYTVNKHMLFCLCVSFSEPLLVLYFITTSFTFSITITFVFINTTTNKQTRKVNSSKNYHANFSVE